MSAQAPPLSMALELQRRFIPGIWGWFLERANRALQEAPPREIFSWWRSVARNRAPDVQGARLSQHLLGLALDLSPDTAVMAAFSRAGFVVVDERFTSKPHVHVQVYPAGFIPEEVFRGSGVSP